MRDENLDLRQQLADMVQVFEQYLRVAVLKDKAEQIKLQKQEEEAAEGDTTKDFNNYIHDDI